MRNDLAALTSQPQSHHKFPNKNEFQQYYEKDFLLTQWLFQI